MKHLLVDYYSSYNLGDDLFIDILMKHFSDCRVDLLSGVKHVPKNLQPNTRLHPYSYVEAALRILRGKVGPKTKAGYLLEQIAQKGRERLRCSYDAYVRIGGSLFMDNGKPEDEIDFSTGMHPEFDYISRPQDKGNAFLIGANLGPVYKESYWPKIREEFMGFRHVCLRDYSSYRMLHDLPHIQYAPDVVFLATQPEPVDRGENVVISVIDMAQRTKDCAIIDGYYQLLRDTILEFGVRNIPVTLVSFCKIEGDEAAIDHLISMLPDRSNVSVCNYDGHIPKLLSLLSDATYIIASRFHSMILAFSFGKPTFPISYNCKIKHYLEDMNFQGNYATLSQIPDTTVADVLYNYEQKIITDCTQHKKYAQNQFRALREFLDQDN